MAKRIFLFLTALTCLALLTACSSEETNATSENDTNQPAETKTAEVPKPTKATLTSGPAAVNAIHVDGSTRKMSTWIGQQPTVVNFWGTWCPPCRREIPDLVRIYKEYQPKGVEIVGMALEREQDPKRARTKVQEFATKAGMDWVMLMGDRSMAQAFKLSGSVPTTIFYDKNGNEVERFIGLRDYDTFKDAIEKALNAS